MFMAAENPLTLLGQAPRITIDEVQKSPAMLTGIKRLVDQRRTPGQFLLTGSANITMLPGISETLAGRIAFIDMFPLTLSEIQATREARSPLAAMLSSRTAKRCWEVLNEARTRKSSLEQAVWRGGYPSAWLEADEHARRDWFKGYVRTYLERDVRDLSRIQRLYEYQKFLSLAAFRCGQILSRADLARDAGLAYTTAGHFLDLLLATFQVFLIEPYFRNIGKRLIKAPKLMWSDTGLAAHLQGLSRWDDAQRLGRSAFLVENRIALELKAMLSAHLPLAKLYYWRTSGGAEVDLVVEYNGRLIPIEVKWSEQVSKRDLKGLESFFNDMGADVPWGMVIFRGRQVVKLSEKLFLVPFERVVS
jgi:predicted AAA+ superfamily ATPase